MSSSRLLILGVLEIRGPTHGYEIRRELVSWRAEQWANIAYGSIYYALNTMAKEGLLEVVDTGQAGNRQDGIRDHREWQERVRPPPAR